MLICLGVSKAKFRESLPNDLQFNTLMRSRVDEIHMPSLKMKGVILKYTGNQATQIQETLEKSQ